MFAVAEFKAEILISAILRNSSSVNLEVKKSFNSQKIISEWTHTLSKHDVFPLPGLGSPAAELVQLQSLNTTKMFLF